MNAALSNRHAAISVSAALLLVACLAASTASAQTVSIQTSCNIAFVFANGFSNPTPYTYAWGAEGSVNYPGLCPTSGGTYEECQFACYYAGAGAVSISVYDANGQFLGSAVQNGYCQDWSGSWFWVPGCQ